jgi:hypothetical protein
MISVGVLEDPIFEGKKVHKGALVASCPDDLCKQVPKVKNYYYLIERKGWEGINDSEHADIKLVEDIRTLEETQRRFPDAILLDLAGGDFVDVDCFRPIGIEKEYDGIQISAWQRFKRPRLIVQAGALIPHRRFVQFGHFFNDGKNLEEIALKEQIIGMTKDLGANVDHPYGNLKTNEGLPNNPDVINYWINRSRVGILSTKVEGVNRFKMECMSADIPMLVAGDVSYSTLKHMNEQTGLIFEPTPEGLAKAVEDVLSCPERFSPRDYVLANTGSKNSLRKLREALREVSAKENQAYHFDGIIYDGRNQSLIWEENAIRYMKDKIGEIESGR